MSMRWVLWKCSSLLPVGPRSHECDYMQTKNCFRFLAAKLTKSANYASSALFQKYRKIMLVMTNYSKNYACTIYQRLRGWKKIMFSPNHPNLFPAPDSEVKWMAPNEAFVIITYYVAGFLITLSVIQTINWRRSFHQTMTTLAII